MTTFKYMGLCTSWIRSKRLTLTLCLLWPDLLTGLYGYSNSKNSSSSSSSHRTPSHTVEKGICCLYLTHLCLDEERKVKCSPEMTPVGIWSADINVHLMSYYCKYLGQSQGKRRKYHDDERNDWGDAGLSGRLSYIMELSEALLRSWAHWRVGWLSVMYLVSALVVLCLPLPHWGFVKSIFSHKSSRLVRIKCNDSKLLLFIIYYLKKKCESMYLAWVFALQFSFGK